MDNEKQTKQLGVLDVFIIVVLVVSVAAIALRVFGINSGSVQGSTTNLKEYVVSFKISDIRESSAVRYLGMGTNVYVKSTSNLLGVINTATPTITNAIKYYGMPDGSYVAVNSYIPVNQAESQDFSRVDVESSVIAKGIRNEEGRFLLNGSEYLNVNNEIEVYTKYLAVTIKITDITEK